MANALVAESVLTSVDLGPRVLTFLDPRSLLRTAVTISLRTIVTHNPFWAYLMSRSFPRAESEVTMSTATKDINWRFEYKWKTTSIRRYQRSLMSCQGRLPQKPSPPAAFYWTADSTEELQARPCPKPQISEAGAAAAAQRATTIHNTKLRQGSACWSALR
jgi:hypothetical protein